MKLFKKPKANFKRKIARTTGIPTTKSGRKRKADKFQGYIILGVIVVLVILFSK